MQCGKQMIGLTKFQERGLLLEKAIDIALNILQIPHTHNPFDKSYANKEGNGCDCEIPLREGKIGIEAKNNNGEYGMSPFWINRECYSRFEPLHVVKIFLCAFLTISQKTTEMMKTMGYYLIEIGFQVTSSNFHYAIEKIVDELCWISNLVSFQTNQNQIPMSSIESQSTTSIPIMMSVNTNYNINVSIINIQMFKPWNCHNLWKKYKRIILTSIKKLGIKRMWECYGDILCLVTDIQVIISRKLFPLKYNFPRFS